jgi:hypothetical protein
VLYNTFGSRTSWSVPTSPPASVTQRITQQERYDARASAAGRVRRPGGCSLSRTTAPRAFASGPHPGDPAEQAAEVTAWGALLTELAAQAAC